MNQETKDAYIAALTLAHNLCVQRSDRHNSRDEVDEARVAHQCACLIATWLDASDEQIAELVAESKYGLASAANEGLV